MSISWDLPSDDFSTALHATGGAEKLKPEKKHGEHDFRFLFPQAGITLKGRLSEGPGIGLSEGGKNLIPCPAKK
jgi:hypothetical protein